MDSYELTKKQLRHVGECFIAASEHGCELKYEATCWSSVAANMDLIKALEGWVIEDEIGDTTSLTKDSCQ